MKEEQVKELIRKEVYQKTSEPVYDKLLQKFKSIDMLCKSCRNFACAELTLEPEDPSKFSANYYLAHYYKEEFKTLQRNSCEEGVFEEYTSSTDMIYIEQHYPGAKITKCSKYKQSQQSPTKGGE